ncbi:hypothetical protein AAMO2058_001439500 [Amorphochlora amoebiformis]
MAEELCHGALIHASLGFPVGKRCNMETLDEGKTLISCVGNTIQLIDLETFGRRIIVGKNSRGLCAVAVHPSHKIFAVAEKGLDPKILLYSYPEVKVIHTLCKGTNRTFSSLEFSPNGKKLASVGNSPDFLLTVWDWKREAIILHTKAFSQEIYRVSFSPYAEGRLYTSGMGHIRFWKMANTFTGLKLQGTVGKFGNVDVSDISAFVELKDGRLISGSEEGYLFMWDENFIQFRIAMEGNVPCHDGMIEYIALEGRTIISAGVDGWIRSWNLADFEFAEVSEEDPMVRIKPTREHQLPGVSIKAMKRGKTYWLIQDQNGAIHKLTIPGYRTTTVARFHAGSITGAITAPKSHNLITCGLDATVICWDLLERKELFRRTFNQPATTMVSAGDGSQCLLMGFKDGMVRILNRQTTGFRLTKVFKPHSSEISKLAISPDGLTLATVAVNGEVFFVDIASGYSPIGFVTLSEGRPSNLCWSLDSQRLLISLASRIIEFVCPKITDYPDESERRTLEIRCESHELVIEPPPLPEVKIEKKNEDERLHEEKQTPIPDLVSFSIYDQDGSILFSLQPPNYNDDAAAMKNINLDDRYTTVYKASMGSGPGTTTFDVKNAATYVSLGKEFGVLSLMCSSISSNYVLFGSRSGRIQVRHAGNLNEAFQLNLHDGDTGEISALSLTFDDRILTSIGKDSNIFVYNVDMDQALRVVKSKDLPTLPEKVEVEDPENGNDEEKEGQGMEEERRTEDIVNTKAYSFEEAKQKKEMDDKRTVAERKKDKMRAEIKKLQDSFEALLKANAALPASERLSCEEFEIDPELMQSLKRKANDKVQLVRDELLWESEKWRVQIKKLKEKFYNNLLVEHIRLYSFSGDLVVTSYRVADLAPKMKQEIEEIHKILKNQSMENSPGCKLVLPSGVPNALHYKPGQSPRNYLREVNARTPKSKKLSGAQKRKLNAERNRNIRELREKEMSNLERQKPDTTKEDPADLRLLETARVNRGDFKLKSSPNYVVPASQRVNTEKKRRQMLLVVDSVQRVKMQYNRKFLAVRDLKKIICERVAKDNVELDAINEYLGIEEETFRPCMRKDEWPEKREQVTDDDLVEYEETLVHESESTKKPRGGFGIEADDDEYEDEDYKEEEKDVSESGEADKQDDQKVAESPLAFLSAAQKQRLAMNRVYFQRRREILKERIEEAKKSFDKTVRMLRIEKIRLDVDLKATDLRMLTLSEELKLLRRFEATENSMLDQRKKAIDSAAAIEKEMEVCAGTLTERRNQAAACLKAMQRIQKKFGELIRHHLPKDESGDSSRAQLTRIFQKKIKRKRQREEDPQNSDTSDSETSEEDSEDEEQCPPDCPHDIFDRILDMRQKNADKQEEMFLIGKARIDIEQKYKSLEIKFSQVQKELGKCEHDLEMFQLRKQRALNQIKMHLPLKLSQIKYLEDDSMPDDISRGLILTKEQMNSLPENLSAVKQEGKSLNRKLKDLKNQYRMLKADLKSKQQQISSEQKKSEDMQILKFGKKIDLKLLRQVGANEELIQIRSKLRDSEEASHKSLHDWDVKIQRAKEDLSKIVNQNTKSLQQLEILRKSQLHLETILNSTAKQPRLYAENTKSKLLLERDEMMKLVKMQENEISNLKTEINILGREGGVEAPLTSGR